MIVDAFKRAVETGRFDGFVDWYAPTARFDAALAGRDVSVEGPQAIAFELAGWWPTPGSLDYWDAAEHDGGAEAVLERSAVVDGAIERHRQYHWLHLRGDRVERHLVRCAKPQSGPPPELAEPAPSFLRDARDRQTLTHRGGLSGSHLERAVLADGQEVIVKHISPAWDWIMRATNDTGREATLWLDGVLQDLPPEHDYPVLAVEREGDGWAIALRDVSSELIPRRHRISRDAAGRLLAAADALHRRFEGRDVPGACRLEDRVRMFAPAIAVAEHSGSDVLPKLIGRGWPQFVELVDDDLAAVTLSLAEDPTPLAAELERDGTTLIHGDFQHKNLGIAHDRIVTIDWAMACQAPAELELSWYLECCLPDIDASREEVIDDWRAIRGPDFDERRLGLALLFELVMSGWSWANAAVEFPNPALRAFYADELDWYAGRARDALETWSPSWA